MPLKKMPTRMAPANVPARSLARPSTANPSATPAIDGSSRSQAQAQTVDASAERQRRDRAAAHQRGHHQAGRPLRCHVEQMEATLLNEDHQRREQHACTAKKTSVLNPQALARMGNFGKATSAASRARIPSGPLAARP